MVEKIVHTFFDCLDDDLNVSAILLREAVSTGRQSIQALQLFRCQKTGECSWHNNLLSKDDKLVGKFRAWEVDGNGSSDSKE